MPVYNAEKYLAEAIRSVIQQTYEKWELLIINDGSTDNSKNVIFSFNDSRLKYFEQINLGVGAARNVGLRNMSGDYFCFLDADDQLTIKSLESRLLVFERSNEIAFVDGAVEICDETLSQRIRLRQAKYFGYPFRELVKVNPQVFFGPSWLVKRRKGYHYFFSEDMTHLEDLWFCFVISSHGFLAYTDEIILKYRSVRGSAMSNLIGIANGYTTLTSNVIGNFKHNLSALDRIVWRIRIRKIMSLSYFAHGYYFRGVKYLLSGR